MTSDGNEYDNITEIVEEIFSKPPGVPNSIQLQLEEETADIANRQGVQEFIFHMLYMITFKGIEKLYGHKNVQVLTESQFDNIQDYVKSYGYVITVHTNGTNRTPWQVERDGLKVLNYKIGFDKLY